MPTTIQIQQALNAAGHTDLRPADPDEPGWYVLAIFNDEPVKVWATDAPSANSLYQTLRSLVPDPDHLQVLEDPEAPKLWSVWLPDEPGATGLDIIGTGDTRTEALEEAIETVRGWEADKVQPPPA